MEVRNLKEVPFEEIVDCFLLAFENYYVKIPSNKDYYKQRWTAAKVDYNLSYGMFENDRLIAFIIHAVDKRFGVKTAFNTGTGVIPEFRGRKIVNSIYDSAIADLRKNGIEKSTLEVIQKNEKAVRAYKNVGFKTCKEYNCFAGNIEIDNDEKIELREIVKDDFDWNKLPNQEFYSWDFQKETILQNDYKFYQIIKNNNPESFFIFGEKSKYLAQFDLLVEDQKAWTRLFKGINLVSNEIKIINLDNRLTDKLDIIHKVKIPNTVNQYEMELIIPVL